MHKKDPFAYLVLGRLERARVEVWNPEVARAGTQVGEHRLNLGRPVSRGGGGE